MENGYLKGDWTKIFNGNVCPVSGMYPPGQAHHRSCDKKALGNTGLSWCPSVCDTRFVTDKQPAGAVWFGTRTDIRHLRSEAFQFDGDQYPLPVAVVLVLHGFLSALESVGVLYEIAVIGAYLRMLSGRAVQ